MRFQESYLSSEQLVRRNASSPSVEEDGGVWVLPGDRSWEYKRTGPIGDGIHGPIWDWKTRRWGSSGSWKSVNQTAMDRLSDSAIPRIGPAGPAAAPSNTHTDIAPTTGGGADDKAPFYKEKWFIPLTVGVVIFGIGAVLIAKS